MHISKPQGDTDMSKFTQPHASNVICFTPIPISAYIEKLLQTLNSGKRKNLRKNFDSLKKEN